MKTRITLLALLFFLLSQATFATHLMGGQITAKQISGLKYEVKLVVYRDVLGIAISPDAEFYYFDLNSSWISVSTVLANNGINFLNGVEEYEYIDTIILPNTGSYNIGWGFCCRNNAILNMTNPGGESLYLNTILDADTTLGNSTPIFLNPPISLAQQNNLFTYNPLPFDSDGDSLTWSLVTPLGSNPQVSTANIPVLGYTLPHADTTQPFTLNLSTGQISWIPDLMGNFVASFLVEEFRGGIKIGEIRRDMQIIVINDPSNGSRAAINTIGWPASAAGNFVFNLPVDSIFNLTAVATDSDNDSLSLTAAGTPFMLSSNRAYYSSISNKGTSTCMMSWIPTAAEVRNSDYIAAFRLHEYHGATAFITDKTVQFHIASTVGIKEISTVLSGSNVYPNPSDGDCYIQFYLANRAKVKVQLTSIVGKIVNTIVDKEMPAGQNVILNSNSKLSKGIYFIDIWVDGKKTSSKKLIITE